MGDNTVIPLPQRELRTLANIYVIAAMIIFATAGAVGQRADNPFGSPAWFIETAIVGGLWAVGYHLLKRWKKLP